MIATLDKTEILVSVIVFFMILSAVSIIPPIIGKKRYRITWWDFVFPFVGITIWFVLRSLDAGNYMSRTNFMFEIFLIMLFSSMVPWIRYLLAFSKNRVINHISFILTFLPIVLAVFLRFFIPSLPE